MLDILVEVEEVEEVKALDTQLRSSTPISMPVMVFRSSFQLDMEVTVVVMEAVTEAVAVMEAAMV